MIALAFIFINLIPGQAASGVSLRILWGSIFSIGYNDILMLFLLSSILTIFIILFYKELMAIMFNRKLAESSGINTKLFYFAILFLILSVFSLLISVSNTIYESGAL